MRNWQLHSTGDQWQVALHSFTSNCHDHDVFLCVPYVNLTQARLGCCPHDNGQLVKHGNAKHDFCSAFSRVKQNDVRHNTLVKPTLIDPKSLSSTSRLYSSTGIAVLQIFSIRLFIKVLRVVCVNARYDIRVTLTFKLQQALVGLEHCHQIRR